MEPISGPYFHHFRTSRFAICVTKGLLPLTKDMRSKFGTAYLTHQSELSRGDIIHHRELANSHPTGLVIDGESLSFYGVVSRVTNTIPSLWPPPMHVRLIAIPLPKSVRWPITTTTTTSRMRARKPDQLAWELYEFFSPAD